MEHFDEGVGRRAQSGGEREYRVDLSTRHGRYSNRYCRRSFVTNVYYSCHFFCSVSFLIDMGEVRQISFVHGTVCCDG